MRERPAWLPPAYCLALATVICAPMFAPGYLLHRDLVSTPRSYLTDVALGASQGAPRAVPQDAAVALLSAVVDGGLVVKILIFAALVFAGLGADALARTVLTGLRTGHRLVAITVAVWNPYVAERLLQGHWSLLVGYAGLLWGVCFAYTLRLDARDRTAWFGLTLSLAAAALTPTGGIIAGIAVAVALADRGRVLAVALAVWIVANCPWIIASFGGAVRSDPDAVGAFAARAEPWLGTIGSLAGLGGIWNAEAVPSPRNTPLALVGTVVLLAVVALGARQAWRAGAVARRMAILAAVAIVLPALAATGWGIEVLKLIVDTVPGAGLLRDTQKFVALAVPFYVLAAAAGCRVRLRVPIPPVAKVAALIVVLLPLAWGVDGALRPVRLPDSWDAVAQIVEHGPSGDVAVLPAGQFRIFTGMTVPVLDPAPRILPRNVLQTGELRVTRTVIAGENTRAIRVEKALLDGAKPAELAREGVRYVLIESSPGPLGDSNQTLSRMTREFDDGTLALYSVSGDVVAEPSHRTSAIAAHLVWALLLLVSSGGLIVGFVLGRAHQSTHGRPGD
ncbi:hypothetical protein [Smaragdicoccus niigatensis]|uniref:hypothetical protein n=1 Tax=Smaragdicoccus niigatensis TaxID=359359 RepID=UPI000362A7DC|nr:hypothetical protein [Smaragdicoccus niigatensis]